MSEIAVSYTEDPATETPPPPPPPSGVPCPKCGAEMGKASWLAGHINSRFCVHKRDVALIRQLQLARVHNKVEANLLRRLGVPVHALLTRQRRHKRTKRFLRYEIELWIPRLVRERIQFTDKIASQEPGHAKQKRPARIEIALGLHKHCPPETRWDVTYQPEVPCPCGSCSRSVSSGAGPSESVSASPTGGPATS